MGEITQERWALLRVQRPPYEDIYEQATGDLEAALIGVSGDGRLHLLLAIDGRSPYSYYTIRGIDHRLEMTWMWCWPWESTARVEFIETIPRIDGRVNGDYAEAARALYGEGYESPPKWQGGRYTATMVKENNQWHIRSLSLVELLDGDEGDAQP